ncbi:Flp family type IVb pilin [Photobacterium toruni]|uniref:Flp family type IVb pilin n=1 Tax=Photobacterium toruni TaxID=1935446 RepID=A0ABU6L575_9GAMM|nr:Flp family type IVb pilin [Photobacterium toruni]
MNAMRAFFAKFQKDQRGVTAIEYGLIAVAMAAVLTVAFTGDNTIAGKLKQAYANISTGVSGVVDQNQVTVTTKTTKP